MYLRVHALTDSTAAVVEGNISMFSGFLGGTAYLANYVLADRSQNDIVSYSYSMQNVSGTNDIYQLSQAVAASPNPGALGFIQTTINDFNEPDGDGFLSIVQGLNAASSVGILQDF